VCVCVCVCVLVVWLAVFRGRGFVGDMVDSNHHCRQGAEVFFFAVSLSHRA
jgi:hypothetical protein